MAHLIDKTALIAEIDKITKALYRQNPDEFGDETQFLAAAEIGTLNLVKDIINTLEVKEVDLNNSFDARVCKVGNTYLKEMDKDAIVKALAHYKDGDKVIVIINAQKVE